MELLLLLLVEQVWRRLDHERTLLVLEVVGRLLLVHVRGRDRLRVAHLARRGQRRRVLLLVLLVNREG